MNGELDIFLPSDYPRRYIEIQMTALDMSLEP